jgi:hypothetical protein
MRDLYFSKRAQFLRGMVARAKPFRPAPSKAALREQAAAAIAGYTGAVNRIPNRRRSLRGD